MNESDYSCFSESDEREHVIDLMRDGILDEDGEWTGYDYWYFIILTIKTNIIIHKHNHFLLMYNK